MTQETINRFNEEWFREFVKKEHPTLNPFL